MLFLLQFVLSGLLARLFFSCIPPTSFYSYCYIVKVEAVHSSETSVNNQAVLWHISEDSKLPNIWVYFYN
jgi:hypothetical protein